MPSVKPLTHPPGYTAWLLPAGLFVLGGLSTLGWAPFEQPWIACVAMGAFGFFLTNATSGWSATVLCLSYGVGFHGFGHGWVFQTLMNQTAAGYALSLLGTSVFILYLSLFFLVPGYLYHLYVWKSGRASITVSKIAPFKWVDAVVFATLFTAGEYARSLFFNGFTSLSTGYLFCDWPLRGWMPVIGVYGCSFLFYFAAISLARLGFAVLHQKATRAIAPGAILFTSSTLAAGAWLDSTNWTHPLGAPVSFRLIQGSILQQDKFSKLRHQDQIDQYITSMIEAPASIIATPETALPSGLNAIPSQTMKQLKEFSTRSTSNLFIGTPSIDSSGDASNSIYHLAPGRAHISRYDKIRLMPFGEYAPTGLQAFTDSLSIPLNNLAAGSLAQGPFQIETGAGPVSIGPLICSDDQTSEVTLHWLPKANLLISSGNLAWFEDSIVAIPQMFQIVRARALESGRPILRVANTGLTALIDHKGHVVAQLDPARTGVLQGDVQPMSGSTPYSQYGAMIIAGMIGFFACVAGLADRQTGRKLLTRRAKSRG